MKQRKSKPASRNPESTLPKRARPSTPLKVELSTVDVPKTSSPYLTAEEAGKYLRVFHSAHTMQQATKRYGIPHIRIGKKMLFLPAQLDEFMSIATEATGTFRRRRR